MIPLPTRAVTGRAIGHRGAAGLAPENGLAALAAAAAWGCRWVEVDVRLSADGVPVLHHDACLPSGEPVVAVNAAAAADRGVVSLQDALTACSDLDLGVNLEIKADAGPSDELAAATLTAVSRTPPPGVLVSSFGVDVLAAVRRRAPALPRALLVRAPPAAWGLAARRPGCGAVHLAREHARPATMTAMRDAGCAVGVYTVNDADEAARLWACGADYVFTDRPDVVRPA